MTNYLKFLAGGCFTVIGFLGMIWVFFGAILTKFFSSIQHVNISLWPALVYFVIAFLVFLTGIYLMRTATKQ